jgi:hypothetical protein
MTAVARTIGLIALALCVIATALWGSLALQISGPGQEPLRTSLAAGFALVGAAALLGLALRRRRPRLHRAALGAYASAFLALVVWWQTIEPSNDRDWRTEEAVLPYATIEGDRVTVHNIRNFDYRTETDFAPAYLDRRFDLRRLEAVDLVAVYWMGPAIAHIYLSFVFADQPPLAISIEARKERGEGYSSIAGFFKQYELFYVVADERDVTRVRTNYRKDPPEDVYLYRLQSRPENRRRIFLEYLRKINALRGQPEFYNTLTTNCTTVIWQHSLVNPNHLPFSWKILASGYVPEYLYEQGALGSSLAFGTLQRRSQINAAAQAADVAPDFSRRIRADLPLAEGTRAGANPPR